jgi:glycosyltransferase involved in cell wall biosynthesis
MALLAQDIARAGHTVTAWSAGHPALPPTEREGAVLRERWASSFLFGPAVWVKTLLGQTRRYDVIVEEVIGGERWPFLSWLLSSRPTVGLWYQDNRPLFAFNYGRTGRFLAATLQSLLLHGYRGRFLLTPSQATRTWLIQVGVPARHVGVHHPKVQMSSAPATQLPYSQREDLFVCIGKFQPLKRFEEAIEVHELLARRLPGVQLALLGRADDAAYLDRVRARIQRSTQREHVHLTLNATDEQKFGLLSRAKALTIHSPVEGFGWTVPEAGLCGVPAIANEGTPSDAVREGINGRKLQFGDVRGYVDLLHLWMTDEAAWRAYSDGARRVAQEFASMEESTEFDRILRAACSRTRRRAPPPRLPEAPTCDQAPPGP